MEVYDIITRLTTNGARLEVVDDKLRVNADKEVMTAELQLLIKEYKNDIISFIKRASHDVVAAPRKKYYKLSSPQKRLYFIYELDRSSLAYNVPFFFELSGALDRERLSDAFDKLIMRHEILRTSFGLDNDEPVQMIADKVDFKVDFFTSAERTLKDTFIRPFDLSKAPLIRAGVLETAPKKHLLMIDMHHIITDGVSQGILINDFLSLYNNVKLPALSLQYKDYAEWQQKALRQAEIAGQREFWRNEFLQQQTTLDLPNDLPRPLSRTYNGAAISFSLSPGDTTQLRRVMSSERTTMNMVVLAIYKVLLSKLGNNEDVTVGVITAGRQHADLESLIGMFVNTLPVRNKVSGEASFRELLSEVGSKILSCLDHQSYPYEALLDDLKIGRVPGRNPLFDVAFVFQNLEASELNISGLSIKPYKHEHHTAKFDLTLSGYEAGEQVFLSFEYATDLFRKETIQRFIGHFLQIVKAVAVNADISIQAIEIITDNERRLLLQALDNTNVSFTDSKTLTALFEEQVLKSPHNIALKFEDQCLSYAELDKRSTRLARLLSNSGVTHGHIVALLMDRAPETIIGMIGILKAGAAYLPLDVDYPSERIKYLIDDSQALVVLTSRMLKFAADYQVHTVFIEDSDNITVDPPLSDTAAPDDLCYVIYTSGTTGNPKGVMVEHRNVVRLLFNDGFQFDFGSNDTWTMFHSHCFDFSVWEIYGALLFGGRLVIVPKMVARDTAAFLHILKKEKVTVLNQTPSAFYNLLREEVAADGKELSIRYVIFGGEALSPGKLKPWKSKYPQARLINMFGITETTVHVTYKEIGDHEIDNNISNVGKPIPTLSVYLLDKYQKMVPQGVVGELYVGGWGVARGYLGRKALTEEKFIGNPYKHGERMYRSGDLARILDSYDIEYIGRIDHQVQLRGFRIELGEIEHHLCRFGKIKEAAVIALEKADDPYLTAYYVSDEALAPSALRSHLSGKLPDYMLPSYYVRVEYLPLTSNGKLDRKALPAPEITAGNNYVPPATKEEELLVKVWSEALGADKISVTDNFFLLGGDSIISIQISARMRNAGYTLSVKDIFTSQTIRDLSVKLKQIAVVPDQSVVCGAVHLTPIQKRFFELSGAGNHHFNQSVMLHFPQSIPERIVDLIFRKVQEHHDALRMVFRNEEGNVIQHNKGTDLPVALAVSDLRSEENYAPLLSFIAGSIQSRIDLENGPLMKLALFHTGDGSHLLIVIHHLVIDGVSWRILLEDIETLYQQISANAPLILPLKTCSFQSWSRHLLQYTRSSEFRKAKAYWETIDPAEAFAIPMDYPGVTGKFNDSRTEAISLGHSATAQLLTEAHTPFNTRMNDILLTALLLTVKKLYGNSTVVSVDLEGHGREDIYQGIDVSRTVGWFTSIYPVMLQSDSDDLSVVIRLVKETLRKIPNNGIDYLLSAYSMNDSAGEKTRKGTRSPICFNYLGQFDSDIENRQYLISAVQRGDEVFPDRTLEYAWDISGKVTGGRLEISLRYSDKQFRQQTVGAFLRSYQACLEEVIGYCCSYGQVMLSPADLTYKGLPMVRLDALQEQYNLKDVYPLSPMQEGMLFHSLLDGDSGHYFEQLSYRLKGDLDLAVVEQSINYLVSRHDILRTVFLYQGFERPVQVVLKERKVNLVYKDVCSECLNGSREGMVTLYQVQDRSVPFDLGRDVLIRLTVLKTSMDEFQLIWSHHHILMDGWCMAIIANEFREIYFRIRHGQQVILPPTTPYARYIEWLENREKEQAAGYWKNYLAGYDGLASLPRKETAYAQRIPYRQASRQLSLNTGQTRKLQEISGRYGVTISTILQCAWGISLFRYNNTTDVVFGAVVSGRPSEIDGIESMIGLFINTVPVRVKCAPDASVGDLLMMMQRDALEGEQHNYHPLSEIKLPGDPEQKLLDHIMIVENYPVADTITSPDARLQNDHTISDVVIHEQTNYDLALVIVPGVEMLARIDYNAAAFDGIIVENILHHFLNVLDRIITDSEMPVSAISILSEKEKQTLLHEANNTGTECEDDVNVIALFEKQADKTPQNIALWYANSSLSYLALKEKSDKIASYLADEQSVVPGDFVGLMLDREEYLIPSMLGIMKAGAAYVPIDTHYPSERIAAIIHDSGLKSLITRAKYLDKVPAGIKSVDLDEDLRRINEHQPHRQHLEVQDDGLAYVIYTSGSTGKPKGVMITHRSLTNYITWAAACYIREERVTFPLFTSIAFDLTVTSVFTPLITGNDIVIYEDNSAASLTERILSENKVDIIKLTPSHLKILSDSKLFSQADKNRIRRFIVGGENLETQLAREVQERFSNDVEIYNEYGPTEATVGCMIYKFNTDDTTSSVPIGRPISNTQIYILDRFLNPVPAGVTGELHIAGHGLAIGYLHNAHLTREKFIDNPFAQGSKLYRTGDLARWLSNGTIEFLGRSDDQVKIRGYRVELEEISQQLAMYDGIRQAVVTAATSDDDQFLAAYYVAGDEIATDALRNFLFRHLPEYMIPACFIRVPEIHLTPNGKLDKKALPRPGYKTDKVHAAPATATEKKLVKLWSDVLKVHEEAIGVDTSFFELGGHSIRAIHLMNRIREQFSATIGLADIFQHTTIRRLARHINHAGVDAFAAVPKAGNREFYPASSEQERLFYVHQLDKKSLAYNISRVYKINGVLDETRLLRSFERLIDRHEGLRTGFFMKDGHLMQLIGKEVRFELLIPDIKGSPATEQIFKEFVRPFDLSTPPLIRCGLLRHREQGNLLLVDIHHIICDGISMNILMNDFKRIYNGSEPMRPDITYADYACWQKSRIDDLPDQKAFWLRKLSGELPRPDLPVIRDRRSVNINRADARVLKIEGNTFAQLKKRAAEYAVSEYMFLLSVTYILLSKMSGNTDIIIGTDAAGRTKLNFKDIVGTFINVLPLRLLVPGHITFKEFLSHVKGSVLEAFENQEYPFDQLVHLLGKGGGERIIDVHFSFANYLESDAAPEGLEIVPLEIDMSDRTTQYELQLEAMKKNDEIRLSFVYSTALYDDSTIEIFKTYYINILNAVLEDPSITIQNIGTKK